VCHQARFVPIFHRSISAPMLFCFPRLKETAGGQCKSLVVGQISTRFTFHAPSLGLILRAVCPNCGSVCPLKVCGVDPNGQPIPGPLIGPWQRPGAGQIGSVGRNSFTGPRFFQSDIGVAKVVRVTERSALRFRADAINAFNKVNLGNPNPCVDCPGGGTISSLALGAAQRRLQFSLRIEF
jgi:hypothetical protein